LLERLDSLEKTIKNKKEVSIDFDEMNQWIKTEVENGVKKVIKHVNPNARRKF
jgi:alpha-L-arabinofuranosidase